MNDYGVVISAEFSKNVGVVYNIINVWLFCHLKTSEEQ